MPYEHKETNGIQDIKGKQREEEGINTILEDEQKKQWRKYCENPDMGGL